MIRTIIKIDEDKCNGCGLCVDACHEGAIGMVDGKARLLRDDYCDGLGNCLPVCPTGAISFEEREAAAFDESRLTLGGHASAPHAQNGGTSSNAKDKQSPEPLACGCPGTHSKRLTPRSAPTTTAAAPAVSRLSQWPVQIKLVPVNAPYFEGANLLVAADCSAFACGDFHDRFIKNRITIIGCPKLDMTEYADKLTAILQSNNIKSLTVVRMEVPCCGGIEHAAKQALIRSGKFIPWQVHTIATDGQIIE